jgi:uncharacterized protein YbcI
MAGSTEGEVRHGVLAAAISNGIVGLMHEYTGRGPVRARTTIDESLVVCILGDALTTAERHLVDGGRGKVVLRGRRAIQSTLSADAIKLVEDLTDRKVLAFMSNNHIDPDIGVEIFILAPAAA